MAGLGSLVVSLALESAEFIKGLNKAEQAAQKSNKEFGAMTAAVAVGGVAADLAMQGLNKTLALMNVGVENARKAVDAEDAFGIDPKKFWDLQAAVDASGRSFEGFPKAMTKFTQALNKMDTDAKGKGAILKEMGLDFRKLKLEDPADAVRDLAKGLATIEDPAMRARVGTELLGKSYKGIAPALAELAKDQQYHSGITKEQIVAMEEASHKGAVWGRALQDVSAIVRGDATVAADEYMKALFDVGDKSEKVGEKAASFADTLSDIVVPSMAVAAVAVIATADRFQVAGKRIAMISAQVADPSHWREIRDAYLEDAKAVEDGTSAKIQAILAANDRLKVARMRARHDFSDIPEGPLRDAEIAKVKADEEAKAKAAAEARLKAEAQYGGHFEKDGAEKRDAEQAKIDHELERLRLAAAKSVGDDPIEREVAKFAALPGVAKTQIEKARGYITNAFQNVAIDGVENDIKKINLAMKDLDASEFDKKIDETRKTLDKTKMSTADVDAELARLATAMLAFDTKKFQQEMRAADNEIAKIGKNASDSAKMDLHQKYDLQIGLEANPEKKAELQNELTQLLANVDKKGAATAAETMASMQREFAQTQVDLIGTPTEKAMAKFNELVRQNPAMASLQADYMQLAKNQEAWANYAKEVADNRGLMQDFANSMVNGLEGVVNGTTSVSAGFKQMEKALVDMLVKAILLKPLQRDLDKLVESFNAIGAKGGAPGGSGGGSYLGALWNAGKNYVTGGSGGGGGSVNMGSATGADMTAAFADAMGGPTNPGDITQVAEGGKPELYNENGNTYLLSGSGAGVVTPAKSGDVGGGTTIVQHFTIDARGADASVDQKIRAAMEATKQQTLAAVQTNANRGGSFSKAVGRA